MRKEKELVALLRGLAELLAEEATRNAVFADKLDHLLRVVPEIKRSSSKARFSAEEVAIPDIYAEWRARGESEFRLWLKDHSILTFRALIKRHDLDASRRTAKWKDPEKLSEYIADQLQSRLARGSSFMRTSDPT